VYYSDQSMRAYIYSHNLLNIEFCFCLSNKVQCWFVVSVGLFVCAEFFSAAFDPILVKL